MTDDRLRCQHNKIPSFCLYCKLNHMRDERDALANDLWSAEDQWGDDYLWKKWGLSKHLTPELKDHLNRETK